MEKFVLQIVSFLNFCETFWLIKKKNCEKVMWLICTKDKVERERETLLQKPNQSSMCW